MTDNEVAELIHNEFSSPTLGVTEQYFEIHQPVFENSQIKIDRIDRESGPEKIIAYLPVKGEHFFFAIYIDTIERAVFSVGTESCNRLRLHATSDELTADELKSFTKLVVSQSWNNGDLKPNGRVAYKFSCIEIEPNPEPDEFEDKLKKLLDFISTDMDGVRELKRHADVLIWATMDFHRGNQLLGGATISLECINIMNDLGLSIDFDFTAWGESFK